VSDQIRDPLLATRGRRTRSSGLAEQLAAPASGVVKFQNDVRDRLEVEGVGVLGEVDPPARDSTRALEWEVTLAREVEFEEA